MALAQAESPASGGTSSTTDGAWSLRCVSMASPVDANASDSPPPRIACEASQAVSVRQGDQDVEILKLAISSIGEEKGKQLWRLIVLLPLDVLLASDIGLGADKVKPELHRYRNCNHLGCFAVVPLAAKLVKGLRQSEKGSVHFRLVNGKAVKVVFPLAGFSSAFDRLSSGKDLPVPIDPAAPAPAAGAAQ